jgi:hypothetical protein
MKPSYSDEFHSEILARAGLPDPLHVMLRPLAMPSPGESWRALAARLDAARPEANRTRTYGLTMAAVLAAIGLTLALVRFGSHSDLATKEQVTPALNREDRVLGPSDNGDTPLVLANGEPFLGLSIPVQAKLSPDQRTVRFRDGSTLLGSPGTVLEPLALTGQKVVLRLAWGRVDVHVVEGGSRSWAIEAGTLSVEVVGTRFTVDRGPRGAKVRVREGVVLVRSPELEDGVERLARGEEVTLADPSTKLASPKSLEHPSEPADVEALLREADQARLSGDLSGARDALETMLDQHSDDPRAALAAYQLALVREQQGESGSAVVAAFASACERAFGGSLKQDCYFRLSRAQARARQRSEARATAERSLREFPNGRHAERLRRFLTQKSDTP